MKKTKRYLCFALAVILLLAMPVKAEESSAWSSAYITAYDSYLHQSGVDEIQVWFDVSGAGRCDKIGVSSIELQSSESYNSGWTTVKTFLPSSYPQMLVENDYSQISYVTYSNATRGRFYRAIVVFYSEKGNGCGEIIDYAETIYLSIIG